MKVKVKLSPKLSGFLMVIIFITITITSLSGCGVTSHLIEESEKTEEVSEKGEIKETQPNQENNLEPTSYHSLNNFPGVTMTIKERTESPDGLILIFENRSDSDTIYGEFFAIEKKVDEKWYQLPIIIEGDYGFKSIGYDLNPGEKEEFEVNWKWLYGSLDDGEYRIIKDILDFRGTGDYDKYYLTAEWCLSPSY